MKSWHKDVSFDESVIGAFRSLAVSSLSTLPSNVAACVDLAIKRRVLLPVELRDQMNSLLSGEVSALTVRKLIDTSTCGPTPADLADGTKTHLTTVDAAFLLLAAGLGQPFGWTSIQHGSIINEVHSVEGHRDLKRSSGFSRLFDFHTEDSFHPFQEHFLALLCVRNQEEAPTVLASIDDAHLSVSDKDILSQPRFSFPANAAHDSSPIHFGIRPGPVLSGDLSRPFLRVNFNQPLAAVDDTRASGALEALQSALSDCSEKVVLEAGDVLFVDNCLIAHARDSYQPAQGGAARWLKRIYITANHRCLGPSLRRDTPYLATS
jgi:L-asparagine oxygenase